MSIEQDYELACALQPYKVIKTEEGVFVEDKGNSGVYAPTSNWGHAGYWIDRFNIWIEPRFAFGNYAEVGAKAHAYVNKRLIVGNGATKLEAIADCAIECLRHEQATLS